MFHTIHKSNLKCIKDLNQRPETITKHKQIRAQTTGYQWGEGSKEGPDKGGGLRGTKY